MEVQAPDVITLDVEMPRMDGLTFLRKIMSQHPLPVVICSTLTEAGSETTLKAMEYGAVDIILKPKLGTRQFLEESRIRVVDAVKAAAGAKLQKLLPSATLKVQPNLSADAVLPWPSRQVHVADHRKGCGGRRLDRRQPRPCACSWRPCPRIRRASPWCSTCPSILPPPLPSAWTASAASPSRRPGTATPSCAARP